MTSVFANFDQFLGVSGSLGPENSIRNCWMGSGAVEVLDVAETEADTGSALILGASSSGYGKNLLLVKKFERRPNKLSRTRAFILSDRWQKM